MANLQFFTNNQINLLVEKQPKNIDEIRSVIGIENRYINDIYNQTGQETPAKGRNSKAKGRNSKAKGRNPKPKENSKAKVELNIDEILIV